MNLFCFLQENICRQSRFIFQEVPKRPELGQKPEPNELQQNTVEGMIGEVEWRAYKATAEKCVKNGLMSQAAVDRWKANPNFFSREGLANAIHWDVFETKYIDKNTGIVDTNQVNEDLDPFFIGLMKEVQATQQVPSYDEPRFETFARFITVSGYTFDLLNQKFSDTVAGYELENQMTFLEAVQYLIRHNYGKR